MELFDKNGCLTDEGLQALQAGGLDELGRLETAEHLAYCDKCMDRYTALLTADALETPPHSAHKAVMAAVWVRLMPEHMGPRCSGRCGSSAGVHHVALRYRGAAAGLPAGAAQLDTGSQPEPDRRTCTAGPTGGGWPSACRAENTGPTGGGRRAEAAGVFFKGGQ